MNPFLAELYETAETVGSNSDADITKMAQAEVLGQIIQNEGFSVDDLSGDDLLKVAAEIFGPVNDLSKIAEEHGGEAPPPPAKAEKEEKSEEEEEEEAQAKVAEADYLGRVMAHAFHQESREIEKEAMIGPLPAKGHLLERGRRLVMGPVRSAVGKAKDVGSKVKDVGSKAGDKAKDVGSKARGAAETPGKAVSRKLKEMKQTYEGARTGVGRDIFGALKSRDPKGVAGSLAAVAKEHPKTVAGLAATPALVAAGAAGKKKKASALDILAEQRANELLNGDQSQPEQTKLASAVEQRAWQMLAEAGYTR